MIPVLCTPDDMLATFVWSHWILASSHVTYIGFLDAVTLLLRKAVIV